MRTVLILTIVTWLSAALVPRGEAAAPCALPCLWAADGSSLGSEINGISQRIPLVLMHGAKSDEHVWDRVVGLVNSSTILGQLLRDKYKIYFFSYRSSAGDLQPADPKSLQGLGDVLGAEIARLGLERRPLEIVAHSQGGLVARSYLQQYASRTGTDAVLRLITLGTMHHGTPLADLGTDGCVRSFVGEVGEFPYLKDMWWDNFDGRIYYPGTLSGFTCRPDTSSPHDNDWLQCLNGDTGRCAGTLPGGQFAKIYAVGAKGTDIDDPVLRTGADCLAGRLPLDCDANHYPDNDGAVPQGSALFDLSPVPIGGRLLVNNCDHSELPRGECPFGAQPFYPRLFGPFIRLRTDKASYGIGEQIAVAVTTVPSHGGVQQPTVVDVAAVRVSATGVQWLRADGSLTPNPTFAAPQYPVPDTTVTIPWRETAAGRYALAVIFYDRGTPIDYTFVVYDVTAADAPTGGQP